MPETFAMHMGLEASILEQVLDGKKTVEGRLNRGKFSLLRVGDLVSLRKDVWRDGEKIETPDMGRIKVMKLQNFASFVEMLDTVGLQYVLPEAKSVEEGVGVYRQFYTELEEVTFGVRAITMRLLPNDLVIPGLPPHSAPF